MKPLSFDWDQWNIQKNEIKHGISALEAETGFFDVNMAVFEDIKRSSSHEKRWIAFGKSAYQNILMIAFTIRQEKIRIISSRKASKNERRIYEKNER